MLSESEKKIYTGGGEGGYSMYKFLPLPFPAPPPVSPRALTLALKVTQFSFWKLHDVSTYSFATFRLITFRNTKHVLKG